MRLSTIRIPAHKFIPSAGELVENLIIKQGAKAKGVLERTPRESLISAARAEPVHCYWWRGRRRKSGNFILCGFSNINRALRVQLSPWWVKRRFQQRRRNPNLKRGRLAALGLLPCVYHKKVRARCGSESEYFTRLQPAPEQLMIRLKAPCIYSRTWGSHIIYRGATVCVCAQSSLLKNSVQRHKSNALSELVCETWREFFMQHTKSPADARARVERWFI